MGRSVFAMSALVLVTQACSNLGQTTVVPEPNGSGGTTGMDAGGPDIQFKVDVAPPPATDGPSFEAISMPTCVQATPKTKNIPPDVLVLLDRSNSMTEGVDGKNCTGTCQNKWVQVTTAVNAIVAQTQDTVNWGLMLFGAPANAGTGGMSGAGGRGAGGRMGGGFTTGAGSCNVSTAAEVKPGPTNAAAIKAAIAAAMPSTSTPTTGAVKNAAAYLKGLTDESPRFLLLATDGVPTCGTQTCDEGQNMCDDIAAIQAVKDAHDITEIPTFVVGIATAGTGLADTTLNKMAMSGGFPKTGTTQYYSVASNEELQKALMSITSMAKTCFFGIDPAIDDMHKIEKVTADGRELNPSDFMQVGNTGVQLTDQACKDYTEGVTKEVVVHVNCNG
jgi:hypothetical protein